MITKERFIKVFNFIKERDNLQNNLCCALEAMTPNCYVDAFIYEDYKTIVLDLIKDSLCIEEEDDILEYWMCDLEYGTKYYDGCFTDENLGKNIDISTAEKLYDYLVSSNKQKLQDEDFEGYQRYLKKFYEELSRMEEQNEKK